MNDDLCKNLAKIIKQNVIRNLSKAKINEIKNRSTIWKWMVSPNLEKEKRIRAIMLRNMMEVLCMSKFQEVKRKVDEFDTKNRLWKYLDSPSINLERNI